MNEAENLEEILKGEALRINTGQDNRLKEKKAATALQEKSFEARAGELASDPKRAQSAAELLENVEDPKIRASLLALAGLTPGTENYEKALAEIPGDLKEVADHVMPATWNRNNKDERRLCDWILFNNSVIDGKTRMGIDFGAIPDSSLLERMTADSVMNLMRLRRYESQEEFTRGFSERIKQMMIRLAIEDLRSGKAK